MSNEIQLSPPIGQINIRARSNKAIEIIESNLGMPLPKSPNTSSNSKDKNILWLGPDEWLLLIDYEDSYKITETLLSCISKDAGAVVNVSDNRVGFILTGPDSESILQQGTSIDISRLNESDVVQTLFSKTQMIIYYIGVNKFQLFVRTSFKDYTYKFIQKSLANYK
ncbi:MAG: sarcosine oxidase subunit gamma family protein [Legionellaceae bacterium]|nr:sarcosine oxidase subunit gamma family protein [Legionellaceae bacterium]